MRPGDWTRRPEYWAQDGRLHLGYANAARSYGFPIWIAEQDRFAHLYLLGRTGVGKSHLLKTLIQQDLQSGRGFLLLDPHGDLTRELSGLADYPRLRVFNAAVPGLRLNPLDHAQGIASDLVVASVLSVFEKLWEDNWGPRLEHLLRNVLYTLLANPGTTLGSVSRLLSDRDYRKGLIASIQDNAVRSYWFDEYAGYSPAFQAVVTAPLLNKLGALLTDHRLRAILDTTETTLDLDRALTDSEAVVINLNKGEMGEGPANLLGGLITARLTLAGLARARIPEAERQPFFAYLDEFPGYATALLATGLSELRKYRLGLILAHQYLSQLTPFIRDAILGNAGTILCFRLGAPDASLIAREFQPVFEPVDLLNLPNYHVYAKLLVRGQVSRPFSMETYTDFLRSVTGTDCDPRTDGCPRS